MGNITEELLLATQEKVANNLFYYVLGKRYIEFSEEIVDGMINSLSIYDAIDNFNNSIGIPENIIENIEVSLTDKCIEYINKWEFYNNFSWEKDSNVPEIFDWLLENIEPANEEI